MSKDLIWVGNSGDFNLITPRRQYHTVPHSTKRTLQLISHIAYDSHSCRLMRLPIALAWKSSLGVWSCFVSLRKKTLKKTPLAIPLIALHRVPPEFPWAMDELAEQEPVAKGEDGAVKQQTLTNFNEQCQKVIVLVTQMNIVRESYPCLGWELTKQRGYKE